VIILLAVRDAALSTAEPVKNSKLNNNGTAFYSTF